MILRLLSACFYLWFHPVFCCFVSLSQLSSAWRADTPADYYRPSTKSRRTKLAGSWWTHSSGALGSRGAPSFPQELVESKTEWHDFKCWCVSASAGSSLTSQKTWRLFKVVFSACRTWCCLRSSQQFVQLLKQVTLYSNSAVGENAATFSSWAATLCLTEEEVEPI